MKNSGEIMRFRAIDLGPPYHEVVCRAARRTRGLHESTRPASGAYVSPVTIGGSSEAPSTGLPEPHHAHARAARAERGRHPAPRAHKVVRVPLEALAARALEPL